MPPFSPGSKALLRDHQPIMVGNQPIYKTRPQPGCSPAFHRINQSQPLKTNSQCPNQLQRPQSPTVLADVFRCFAQLLVSFQSRGNDQQNWKVMFSIFMGIKRVPFPLPCIISAGELRNKALMNIKGQYRCEKSSALNKAWFPFGGAFGGQWYLETTRKCPPPPMKQTVTASMRRVCLPTWIRPFHETCR